MIVTLIKNMFENLLGKGFNTLINNNWVEFSLSDKGIFWHERIDIRFLGKDSHDDTVCFCRISYYIDSKIWSSENCIDNPEIEFDTFAEMKEHLNNISDSILRNGFKIINL